MRDKNGSAYSYLRVNPFREKGVGRIRPDLKESVSISSCGFAELYHRTACDQLCLQTACLHTTGQYTANYTTRRHTASKHHHGI